MVYDTQALYESGLTALVGWVPLEAADESEVGRSGMMEEGGPGLGGRNRPDEQGLRKMIRLVQEWKERGGEADRDMEG